MRDVWAPAWARSRGCLPAHRGGPTKPPLRWALLSMISTPPFRSSMPNGKNSTGSCRLALPLPPDRKLCNGSIWQSVLLMLCAPSGPIAPPLSRRMDSVLWLRIAGTLTIVQSPAFLVSGTNCGAKTSATVKAFVSPLMPDALFRARSSECHNSAWLPTGLGPWRPRWLCGHR